jgi:F-type H+-transporting ATPase subunit gamma
VNVLGRVEFATAREIAALVNDLYSSARVDAVYLVYSEFKNVIAPRLMLEKLLPVETLREEGSAVGMPRASKVDYIYEQPAAHLLNRLLPRYVETQVFHAMLESSAAEHAARMTAMDSATNNAGEVIEALTLHMNKVRQAAITKEIIEIIGGAASTA